MKGLSAPIPQVQIPKQTTRCPDCGSYPKQRKRGYCTYCDEHGAYR